MSPITAIITFLRRLIPRQLHPGFVVERDIAKSTHNKTCSGPFAGMGFGSLSVDARYLYGTHELELSPLIEELCKEPFDTIVNVGAELGYYAVGMALRCPQARVIAFEMDSALHISIKKLAEFNKVEDRLDIRGFCDAAALSSSIEEGKKCLVIMDIEGGEESLLDPLIVPRLRDCHILVELHKLESSIIPDTIIKRFKSTHNIDKVTSRTRTAADLPAKLPHSFLFKLLNKYYVDAMAERCPGRMRWFYLTPGLGRKI